MRMDARTVLTCLGAVSLPFVAGALNHPNAAQTWLEWDVNAPLSDKIDFSWISQGRYTASFAHPAAALTGLELGFHAAPQLIGEKKAVEGLWPSL